MVESETIGKAHHMFYMCDIPSMFLIWHVQGHASVITPHDY